MQLQKFGDYLVRFHEGDSLDTFLAREKLTVPVLMQLNGKGQKLGTVGRTIRQFDTISDESGEFRPYEAFERPVYRVQKNPEANNAFAFVTVGRSPNNDIFLDHGHVSKLTAILLQEGGNWILQNMSPKGTLVNGSELQREEKACLVDGTPIKIKSINFTYHSPSGLYAAILEERAQYRK